MCCSRECSPIPVDIIHGTELSDTKINHSWIVVIDCTEKFDIEEGISGKLEGDAWKVEVPKSEPVKIKIKGSSERAELYALYHIAKCLEKDMPPSEWAHSRRPLIPHRYAWVSAGNCWRVSRPFQITGI